MTVLYFENRGRVGNCLMQQLMQNVIGNSERMLTTFIFGLIGIAISLTMRILFGIYGNLIPYTTNNIDLGSSSKKWKNVYATTFTGALSGNASTATKDKQDGNGNVITRTYLPLTGGTLTGPLIVNGGDGTTASKFILATGSGQITNSATGTLFGYTSASTLAVGHSSVALTLRGSGSAPTYNGNDLALASHTHAMLVNGDDTGKVALILDGNYYYMRPHAASKVLNGSTSFPWYKTYTERLEVTVDKPVFTCIGSNGSGSTVSSAANLYVAAGGTVSRTTTTSSRTIKHDIKALQNDEIRADRLYDLPVYQAKYNKDILGEEDNRYLKDLPMFIIEEMDKAYPIAVDKPSDNPKDWSWNAQYIIPPMLKLIQDQHKEDIRLAKEITRFDGELSSVKAELRYTQNKLNAAMDKIAEQEKEIEQLKLVS